MDEHAGERFGMEWNVVVTPNGKLVVATLSDGTVRWYRMSDGKEEVLALFLRANQKDWVMWRPDGYYASSELGDNLIGWHVNRGKAAEPDFYRAVQFERQFYRPDLMRNRIASISGVSSATADTSPEDAFNIQHIDRIAPPRIRINSQLLSQTGEIEVNVSADKMSQPMQDITVYANQLPVTKSVERQLKTDERDKFQRIFRFPASSGDNLLRVEVNNGVSLGLAEQWLEAPLKKATKPVKGNLYVLAVGVNKFEQRSSDNNVKITDLSYADNDAVKLAELLGRTKKTHEFNQVHIQVLSDSSDKQPTHQNILEALRVFEQAEPNDTVLLFLASHGFSDAKGNYCFLPKDGKFIERFLCQGKSPRN